MRIIIRRSREMKRNNTNNYDAENHDEKFIILEGKCERIRNPLY